MSEQTIETIIEALSPYLIEEKPAKEILREELLASWRRGFRQGRLEGRLDQRMMGGES